MDLTFGVSSSSQCLILLQKIVTVLCATHLNQIYKGVKSKKPKLFLVLLHSLFADGYSFEIITVVNWLYF